MLEVQAHAVFGEKLLQFLVCGCVIMEPAQKGCLSMAMASRDTTPQTGQYCFHVRLFDVRTNLPAFYMWQQ